MTKRREYLDELDEYAKTAEPICGWARLYFPSDQAEINVALCESHVMDWLAARGWFNVAFEDGEYTVTRDGEARAWHGTTRLLALINAVAATKEVQP